MARQFNVSLRSLRGVTVVGSVLAAVTTALVGCGGDGPSGPLPLGVVTDLTATAVDAFQVDLTWSPPGGQTSYNVHRSTEAGFVPSLDTRIAAGLPADATQFRDKTVLDNAVYYYKLLVRKDTESTLSNQATASTPTIQPSTLVSDAFDRTVDPGWGTADFGGAWKKADYGPMRVDGSVGVIEVVDSVPQINVLEDLSTYGRYVNGTIRFMIDNLPDAGFHAVEVYARRDDDDGPTGGNHYRFSIMAHHDGILDVRIEKEVDHVQDFVTDPVETAPTFEPGVWYWIRWEATGTAPTHLRLKVWPDGAAEPGAWDVDVEHNEPGLDVKGTTGVRVHVASGHQVFPVLFSFDDLTLEGD